jgi:hypothetical protein
LENRPRRFTYFMARPGPTPPRWIRPAQWAVLGAWLLFVRWLAVGEGYALLYQSYYNLHGVFTDERIWGDALLPNLGLVSLPLLAMEIWLQVLWQRCRTAVEGEPGAWRWTGRRGPAAPDIGARTPGGAWLKDRSRWWYVAHGFTDESGKSFLSAAGGRSAPWWHPARFASPLALLLLLLGAGAWALQRPVAENRRVRNEVSRALWAGREAETEALVRLHPEFRPWVRYVQSQRGCDTARCLHEQITTRLEGLSIGPVYSGDEATLLRLLILNGWSALALRIVGPESPQSFEIHARLGRASEARRVPQPRRGKAARQAVLVLMLEDRLDEALAMTQDGLSADDSQRTVTVRAVLCYLNGRCVEAERLAGLLMSPQALVQPRLEGEAPSTGLGALQRAARPVMIQSAYAVGLALLGHLEGAAAAWQDAQRLSMRAGLPGLLDVDRVLLRRVAPGGPWSDPVPPHRMPPPGL